MRSVTVLAPGLALGVVFAAALQAAPSPFPPPVTPAFDPASFTNSTRIDNPLFPLAPGTTFVYDGVPKGQAEHTETEVTHDTRAILGVTCVVVHDRVWNKGVLTEDTFDWYAQDRAGNVWYMGENSAQLAHGVVVGHEGSWEAGVNGAQPGIVMEAHPRIGDTYRQEYLPGVAEDEALVAGLTESASVPYGSWAGNVLRTREWSPLEPSVIESKLYAPGVGLVREETLKGGSAGAVLVEVRH